MAVIIAWVLEEKTPPEGGGVYLEMLIYTRVT